MGNEFQIFCLALSFAFREGRRSGDVETITTPVEEEGGEDFNNNIRERTGISKEHSPMIKNQDGKKGGGDVEVTTSFHTCAVDEVISNDQKCTRIRPKIITRRS